MRLNERHAAIAVLFLVVILLVGFFWQDDSADRAPEQADQQLARQVEPSRVPGQVEAAERPGRRGAPLSGIDEVPGTVDLVTTRGLQEDAHSVDPSASAPPRSRADLPSRSGPLETRPRATDRDQPSGGLVPGRRTAPTEIDELAGLATNARSQRGFLVVPRPALDRAKAAAPSRDVRAAASKANAEPPAAPVGLAREYTVRSGDMLSLIAQKECGTTRAMEEICRLNGLSDRDIIREGMVLKLPATTSPTPARVASKAPVATEGRRTVTMRSGETLSIVLDRELGTYKRAIAAVKSLNPGLDPDRVAVGQLIVLPFPAELTPAPAGAARPRAAASQAPRVASSSNRADRSKYVVR
ncbi:MAG: LysM peptidoglycan-binding domain-containing protein [Planctomycetota bacterium]|nr:LysM peptidoglycan-binding domain-containing protein [Planctomycetota bacterium]